MFAKVIVDVPAKQTNRPFDYKVPPSMEDWIEIGSRVGVPFGPRRIQGFVVALQQASEFESGKIKSIEQILDVHPPLTPELVELSDWMSEKYICSKITALQAMIPGALKAKYERYITVSEDKLQGDLASGAIREIIDLIRAKGGVEIESLLARFPDQGAAIKQLISTGVLNEAQTIKDRLSAKKALTVFPPADPQLLQGYADQLPGNAVRQKQVLAYLIEHPEPIRLTELTMTLEVGAGTVKGLADKQWIEMKEVEVLRDPYANRQFQQSYPLALTEEQSQVFQTICKPLHAKKHRSFLLHGVTGSGKTEIYLQSIHECLEQGREAIVLVPEISLTPQMVERFKSRFGDLVAVLHSRLSQGERYDEWRKIQHKQVKVAIGARSAIFAPFTRLGLIIMDEEHEASYKQEDSPKYHAREIAMVRAKHHQAVVILGSATPGIESFHKTKDHTKADAIELLTMESRVEGRPLPEVEIIDMREELKNGNRSMLSRPLHQAIEDRLQKKEQMVLMLNRRGFSTFIMCRSCGYVASCPHCDISLTYHRQSKNVRCHYCGYAEREMNSCPDCESEHIRFFGTGTQRVEEELSKLFPGIRVIRMDVDTTTQKGSHEKLLNQFRDQKADVLLGTQMVAKGLDFPNVTLVGVIAADTILNLPDFRAGEKTFQLMTQVAGRAGRHQLLGKVYIQTYNPEHYSIVCAGQHDYRSFVTLELDLRKERGYPPYCELILITLSHEQVPLLVRTGELLVKYLKDQNQRAGPSDAMQGTVPLMEILGPVASPIPRIKDRYRFQCMVKYGGDPRVVSIISETLSHFEQVVKQEKLQISVDVDPQIMM
jgi:primosomal protein N' (replication factor Y)